MTVASRCAVLLFLFFLPAAAFTQATPAIDTTDPLLEGQTTVTGTAQATDSATFPTVVVTLCLSSTKPAAAPTDCSSEATAVKATVANGKFTATLPKPLTTSEWIYPVQVTTKTDSTKTPALFGAPVQVKSLPPAAITSPLTAPLKYIAGTGQKASADLYPSVKVYVCSSASASDAKADCSGTNTKFQQTLEPASLANAADVQPNGQFTANLSTPIPAGNSVWLTEAATLKSGVTMPDGKPAVVTSSDSIEASLAVKPSLSLPLKDGDAGVTGTATPSAADGSKVIVSLKLKKQASDADYTTLGTTAEVGPNGMFTIPHRLTEGEIIVVHQASTNPQTPITIADSDPATVNAPDNARIAMDFIGGLLLSQNQQNFSQTNLFLGLNMDETFHKPGWYWRYEDPCDTKHPRDTSHPPLCKSTHAPGLNGFFQVRLTAIPVTSGTATSTTTTTANPTPAATSYDTFLTTPKSAHFETGLYMPLYFGHVNPPFSTKEQSFFIAPIARFGFNTLVDSVDSTTSTSTTNSTTTTTQTALAVSNPNTTVYSFGVAGARIGTSDMKPGSPRIVNYLDLGAGKFSNLRNLYCSTKPAKVPYSTTTNGTTTTTLYNPCYDPVNMAVDPTKEYNYTAFRVLMEGYMDIDGFIIGFSINKSVNWRSKSRPKDFDATYSLTEAPDDVRFLFGYKFDVNKLLASVKKRSSF